ncbi:extracellular matrix protein 2 [Paramisgurnus dabryanus]|uniref:extracellular matrix protein 2 n=1 Tax=Paramisgurnus dabryanus TaxID=90735 RepID=UPI0031F44D4A
MTSQIRVLLLHTVPFLVIRTHKITQFFLLREAVSLQDPHLSVTFRHLTGEVCLSEPRLNARAASCLFLTFISLLAERRRTHFLRRWQIPQCLRKYLASQNRLKPVVSAMRLILILAFSLFVCLTFSLATDQGRPHAQGRKRGVGPKRARKQTSSQHAGTPERNVQVGSINIKSYKNTKEPQLTYDVMPGKSEHCVFRGITMFDKTVWSPKPCVTCLCSSGEVVCDQIKCPALQCQLKFQPMGECCPICIQPVVDVPEFSGDSPIPDNRILRTKPNRKESQEKERIRKKDAERKRRKKEKKEEAERRKKLKEEKAARDKEEAQRRLREEAEEKAAAEERKRRMEEQRRSEEERARKMEMEQREMMRALEEAAERTQEGLRGDEAAEEEEVVWLRGDVFQMPSAQPTAASGPLPFPPLQEPTEPGEEEPEADEEFERAEEVPVRVTTLLPPGCTISDVIITCENAKLTGIPPLSIPELKSLNLQGNEIKTIPAGAFNGIPNLEWIDLGKNKISSSGIDPQTFKGLKFLTRLYMDGNLLEQIPNELPPTLQELKINENNLKEIEENSFEGLSSLVTLEMEGNLLSEGNVNPLAFRPLKELSYLRLSRNHFRTIPQGLPASLQELYMENNLIEEISETVFNNSMNINVVVLRHNKLDESRIAPLAWINHRNLESIDLSHNNFYLVPSFLPKSLVHLVLVGNQIERIPGYVFAHMEPGLEYLYLSYNKLDGEAIEPESFFGSFNTMTELCLDHNQLTAIPVGINEMTTLHFLRLDSNKIRHISEDAICDPLNEEDSHLVALRLENNFLDQRKIPPTAFSCVRSYSSVVLKPQKIK